MVCQAGFDCFYVRLQAFDVLQFAINTKWLYFIHDDLTFSTICIASLVILSFSNAILFKKIFPLCINIDLDLSKTLKIVSVF